MTEANCLSALYPQIGSELDDARNGGITGRTILPSSSEVPWFKCPHGHRYRARVSNHAYLGRGCPICNCRNQTSFAEQAFRFYLQKCAPDLQSMQVDLYTGKSVDILLPSQRTAIEFNSLYYHTTVNNGRRILADLDKAYTLAQYYRVYIIAEEGAEQPVCHHPLIQFLPVPVFRLIPKICRRYDSMIWELLRSLFPDRDAYPNIHIMRDQLSILQQYIMDPIKDSFEDLYPLLARDWHPTLNGHLAPDMFAPTVPYKFYWICRNCGEAYPMSMGNRIKVNPDTCPFCRRKCRYKSPLLSKTYPFLKGFWSKALNPVPFSEVAVASEKFGVFELFDGKIVPVRICDLSAWLYKHPDRSAEEYLRYHWETSRPSLGTTTK